MQRITIRAAVGTYAGYHFQVNETILGLARLGYHVNVRASGPLAEGMFGTKISQEIRSRVVMRPQPEEWELVIHPPDYLTTPEKKTLYSTTLESTRLRPTQMECMRAAKAIIVPCQWNASCLSAMGIDVPIFVVNEGVNPDVFNFAPIPIGGPFVFGAGGRLSVGGGRKGLHEIIEAFQKAFVNGEDVRLRIKVFSDCNIKQPDDNRVELVTQFLTEGGMANFMKSLTVFCSYSKGEGWGLMPNEAMACGRPVIGCLYGGQAEYMNRHNSFPVEFTHEPATGYYDGCGTWSEPNMDDMVRQMQFAYQNRDEVVRRGMIAANDVRHLTWKRTAENTVKVLKAVGALE